jgi:glutamate synthase (NADPH/NADH) small chain
MPEYKRPESPAEFEANFEQLKPLMTATQSYYESSRCLFCYDAPCVTACPTSIDIPLFIRQINAKNDLGAAKTIYEANYFGYACGKVCPTEVLCEGACVYNHQGVKPIEIGRLQSYATEQAMSTGKKLYQVPMTTGSRVAIIGAGPAGISCACELRLQGIEVDIYEAKSQPSGLTVHGVAPYKITNEEVIREMEFLQAQFGFKVLYDHPITTKEDIDYLESNYQAIFLGIGLGATSGLHIPGETLANVYGAVEIIEQIRMNHHHVKVPGKVIVLGGGNTAMDAASETARLGAEEVLLAYRRSKEAMGAYEFEYDLAKGVGVKGLFNVAPVAINGDGKVEGITFIRTQEVNGQLENIPGSAFTIACDWVIKATGQSKMTGFLSLIDGLQLDNKGRIIINEYSQTTNPRYFAGGDAVSGGKEVVNAAAEGKKAAQHIVQHINKLDR